MARIVLVGTRLTFLQYLQADLVGNHYQVVTLMPHQTTSDKLLPFEDADALVFSDVWIDPETEAIAQARHYDRVRQAFPHKPLLLLIAEGDPKDFKGKLQHLFPDEIFLQIECPPTKLTATVHRLIAEYASQ